MLDNKMKTPFIALVGAIALMASAPAFAQDAAPAAPAADAAAAPAAAPAGEAAPAAEPAAPPTLDKHGGKLNIGTMFMDSDPVVKVVMIGLALASIFSWAVLITKMLEFRALNRVTDNFLEAFRGAKSINDMNRIALAEEFDGNHRDTTIMRAQAAVGAVQASLARRLSGGMQYLASVGSNGPFIGLFGTVYGIMNSFIGIANTNTTNLAVVAPGIAEALLATGLGLFAAIPSVIFYNYFQTKISAYGARTEGFVAELMNAISRQLDKGA
jgi:biopolymer transport protein ExbB